MFALCMDTIELIVMQLQFIQFIQLSIAYMPVVNVTKNEHSGFAHSDHINQGSSCSDQLHLQQNRSSH